MEPRGPPITSLLPIRALAAQEEAEATADGIVQQLRLVKDAPGGVFLLDRELGQRTFVPPSAAGP